MESTMTHTGDDYEARARASRHQELRRLAKALSRLLFKRGEAAQNTNLPTTGHVACDNDQAPQTIRAA